jgi:hypothetical protein
MKSFKVAVLVLALLPTLAQAEKKPKKPSLPEVFEQAHLVYVQAVDGTEFDSNVPSTDRVAIAAVRDAIKAWGRYIITPERGKADLVIFVRKGRPGEGRPAASISALQDPHMGGGADTAAPDASRAQGPGMGGGGGAGVGDDLLKVCPLNPDGKPGKDLWSRSLAGGLDAPRMLLFAQFKEAVEKAYPTTAPSAPSAP